MSLIYPYAHYKSFTVRNMESVQRVMERVEIYGRASGAKVNNEKSEIMFGEVKKERCTFPLKIIIRTLGIIFGEDSGVASDVTWMIVLNKIGCS